MFNPNLLHQRGFIVSGVDVGDMGGLAAAGSGGTDTAHTVKSVEGETLVMKKVSRLQMGSYLCIASNDVPPAVSKRVTLRVECKCVK